MKLILLRHCKSAWGNFVDDESRPLNERGQRDALKLGKWIQQYAPQQALVSSAKRTQQTFARLGITCSSTFHDDLYLAEPREILNRIRSSAQSETVLIIAHNPGIAELAATLVTVAPNHTDFLRYPTGACLVAETDGGWGDLSPQSMRVVNFTVPRDLS